jgi:dephospho-CoA kinase
VDIVRDVRWIGGSPCAGKSTVAALLAEPGEAVYSCDDAFAAHAAAVDASRGPTLRKVTNRSAARRLAQPVDVQVADVLRAYREEFPLITADLLGRQGRVLAEGAALLPELLAGSSVPADRAVWLVPTVEFQLEHYRRRPWARELVRRTQDPEESFRRWMARDARFAALVAGQARALGYPVVRVDGRESISDVLHRVRTLLGG